MKTIDPAEFETLRAFLATVSPVTPRANGGSSAPLTPERLREIERALSPESTRPERLELFDNIVHDEEALAYVAARLRGLPPDLALAQCQ